VRIPDAGLGRRAYRGGTMTVTLALAGDTMLGRGVAERLRRDPGAPLLHPALAEVAGSADLFVANLECCVSDRGAPIDEPGKPFFFRAPPLAAERLAGLGVGCVTLANNHVLDFGEDALLDTLAHLTAAGIATIGAGADREQARHSRAFSLAGRRLRVVAAGDHPPSYAAGADRPGIAFADLADEVPAWLLEAARPAPGELVVATVHWGPNMSPAPVAHVRRAAAALETAGATLVAGHSAHVPQGVRGRVLFDLGDFIDDYATDPELRNDLSLLWLVTLDENGPRAVEGWPVLLEYGYTRPAADGETARLARLLRRRCAATGSHVELLGGRFVFDPGSAGRPVE
jgi:poly-gamma-glutamate synthesis protein (capsule biosynthesis protein)